ncbi:MAG: aldo/keto reductase [Micromonosporaceae bacterium]|nr:aldo/keto reductase [Micromonosporaceae bacterium]
MPLLGFGTWQARGSAGRDAVREALRVGYRHLDTATGYRNQRDVGAALRDSGVPRSEVFITTKLPPENAGAERRTITESLRELGTDYVDLWLIHWPPRRSASPEVWQAFREIRDQGLVRDIGVSNYSIGQVDELVAASGEAPAVNQIPWSPSQYDAGLLAGSRERGVVVEGYSPLVGTSLRDSVLSEVAASHGVTAAQVVLRWHLQHGVVAIPKSVRPERIAENFGVFGFELDASEMARIDELGRS